MRRDIAQTLCLGLGHVLALLRVAIVGGAGEEVFARLGVDPHLPGRSRGGSIAPCRRGGRRGGERRIGVRQRVAAAASASPARRGTAGRGKWRSDVEILLVGRDPVRRDVVLRGREVQLAAAHLGVHLVL